MFSLVNLISQEQDKQVNSQFICSFSDFNSRLYFKLLKWRQPHKVSVVSRPSLGEGVALFDQRDVDLSTSPLFIDRRRVDGFSSYKLLSEVHWKTGGAVQRTRVQSVSLSYYGLAKLLSEYRSTVPTLSTRFSLSLLVLVQDTSHETKNKLTRQEH